MAHMLKNTKFKSASYAMGIPVGTSSVGPDSPTVGQARWNTTTNRLEYYTGTVWYAVAHEGNANVFVNSTATGDGANVVIPNAMTVSYAPGEEAKVLVHVGTVYQIPDTNYTFMGNTAIKFSSAPSNGAAIVVVHNLGSTTAL